LRGVAPLPLICYKENMRVFCRRYPSISVLLRGDMYQFVNGECEIPDALAIELARNPEYTLEVIENMGGKNATYSPFDPSKWIDDRKLIWDGPIGYNNGYGNASSGFMMGLDKVCNLFVIASEWQGTNLEFIPDGLKNILGRVTSKVDSFYVKCFPASEFGTRVAERYIGYTMLEASRIPTSWVKNINDNCERVIVPCSHQRQAFLDSGVKRDVKVIPIGLEVSNFPEVKIPKDDEFIFGTMGTLTYRKGTDVLVKAFLKAFPRKSYPNVGIYIKTIPVGGIAHAWFIDGELIKKDDRIRLYTQSLSPKDLISEFFAKINCFVFPTRGEGFGLPVAEAMCVGLPVIATNWSGTGDFVKEDVAYPLSYKLVDVPRGDWKGYPEGLQADGMQWAEPDVDHLVELMKEVYNNREKASKKGKKARKYVLENLNNVTTSQMLVDYLDSKF